MTARPEPPTGGAARPAAAASPGRTRTTKLSRDAIVNAALTFLDREGWDALTINALATQLGTKGPSLYNHVDSLEDLRRTVRMRVVGDIIGMLNTVGDGRTRDDAVVSMASAYRSYAHHHPGRYSAFTRFGKARALEHPRTQAVLSLVSQFLRAGGDQFTADGQHRPFDQRPRRLPRYSTMFIRKGQFANGGARW